VLAGEQASDHCFLKVHPMFTKPTKVALACAGIFATISSAQAQTSPEFNSVIITASKFKQYIQDTPAAITVITADDISKYAIESVTEAIMRLGGIQGRQDLNGGDEYLLDLGGFGATSEKNQVIVVDGIRMYDETGSFRLTGIPIDSVERIEIQRGSAAVLYGEGASGGVINIITKNSENRMNQGTSGNVDLGTGSYGVKSSRVNLSHSGEVVSGQINLSDRMSDGYRVNSSSREQNASLGLQGRISNSKRFGLNYRSNELYARLPGALSISQYNQDPRQADSSKLNDWGLIRTSNYGAFFETDLSGNIIKFSLNQRIRNKEGVDSGYPMSSYDLRSNNLNLNIKRADRTSFGENTLIYGVEITDWRQVGSYTTADSDSNAIYAKNSLNIVDLASQIDFGLRLENLEKNREGTSAKYDENLTAWDIGLSTKMNKASTVYGRYARSYRLPGAEEYNYTISNVDLLPQLSFDKELGIKIAMNSTDRFHARLFRYDITNEIGYDSTIANTPFPGGNINFSPTFKQGFELDFFRKDSVKWEYGLLYTYQESKFKDGMYAGKDVPISPRYKISMRSLYRISNIDSVGLQGNLISRQVIDGDFANTKEMPSYFLIDGSYTRKLKNIDLNLRIRNILDKKYYSYATATGGYSLYPDPGRNFMATIKARF
jgi:iron complex outermembrane receptor protein